MSRVLAFAIVALAGCVNVASQFTCTEDAQCVGSGSGRCEASGNCSFPDATCGNGGYRYDTSAGSRAGVCVIADGVVQVDIDFSHATTHIDTNCAIQGDAALEFELTLSTAQTIVVDTPGIVSEIVVYTGTCPPAMPQSGMCPATCGSEGLTVEVLDVGTYCIVAEQAGSTTTGLLRLFPIDGPAVLPKGNGTTMERTCNHPDNPATPSCFTPIGATYPMFVGKCPSAAALMAEVMLMPQNGYAMGMSLRSAVDNSEVACVAPGAEGAAVTLQTSIDSSLPYWLMLDGAGGGGAGQCGTFTVTYNLQ